MTHKKQILTLYPDAIICKDSHNYGMQPGGERMFIVLHQIPIEYKSSLNNDIIIWDFQHRRDTITMHPLGSWSKTIEEAWKSAWERLQEKIQTHLAE